MYPYNLYQIHSPSLHPETAVLLFLSCALLRGRGKSHALINIQFYLEIRHNAGEKLFVTLGTRVL